MPPLVKYSKEKIIDIALKMVEEKGMEYVSARSIAKELGCSICPIFSCFESMDVLKTELLKRMFEVYSSYIAVGMKENEKVFKGAGLAYIKFAKENKNYFKELFMCENRSDLEALLKFDSNNENIKDIICKNTGLGEDEAIKFHKYNWIFVHGIAVMLATNYCVLSDEEISGMLSEEYLSLLNRFKGGK